MLEFWFDETTAEARVEILSSAPMPSQGAGRTTRDGIPLEQILADRPDVFRAYFDEFYGARNDRNSDAWIDRVGGGSVLDYANYWYEQHGRWEGYGQGGDGAGAPREDGDFVLPPGIVETGRTTPEGYLISQILAERPDVFRAFFTEFYGPNNDHKSTAWLKRVGGETPEDYANYWWETYGRYSGWKPSQPASAPDDVPSEDTSPGDVGELSVETPLVFEQTEAGIIMRPAQSDDIIEDGFVVGKSPGLGASAQSETQDDGAVVWDHALPLVIHYREDGVDLTPAQPGEVVVEGVVLVGQALADYLAGMF